MTLIRKHSVRVYSEQKQRNENLTQGGTIRVNCSKEKNNAMPILTLLEACKFYLSTEVSRPVPNKDMSNVKGCQGDEYSQAKHIMPMLQTEAYQCSSTENWSAHLISASLVMWRRSVDVPIGFVSTRCQNIALKTDLCFEVQLVNPLSKCKWDGQGIFRWTGDQTAQKQTGNNMMIKWPKRGKMEKWQ